MSIRIISVLTISFLWLATQNSAQNIVNIREKNPSSSDSIVQTAPLEKNLRLPEAADTTNKDLADQEKAVYHQGLILMRSHDYAQSLTKIDEIPGKQKLAFRLLAIYNRIQLGQFVIAKKEIVELLGEKPCLTELHALRAYLFREMGRLDYAVAYGNEGVDSCGDQPLLHLEIASALFLLGNYQSARVYLRKILKKKENREYYFALYLDGLMHLKSSNFEYALFRLMQALHTKKAKGLNLVLLYNNIGVSHEYLADGLASQGNEQKRLEHRQKAQGFYQDALEVAQRLKLDYPSSIIEKNINDLSI